MVFYALAATLISAAFATTLFVQYRARPRPYLLAWSVALAIYAVAACTEVIGAAAGWDPLLYRVYYYFGGILVVGVLALGTIYLLAPRFGRSALLVLVVLAGIGLAGTVGANLQAGPPQRRGGPPLRNPRPRHRRFPGPAHPLGAGLCHVGRAGPVAGPPPLASPGL